MRVSAAISRVLPRTPALILLAFALLFALVAHRLIGCYVVRGVRSGPGREAGAASPEHRSALANRPGAESAKEQACTCFASRPEGGLRGARAWLANLLLLREQVASLTHLATT